MINFLKRFSKFEKSLWCISIILITIAFIISGGNMKTTFISSIIGATSLILIAKGNIWGLLLTVVFSIFYGIVSYFFGYYGEMITYLGMTAPVNIISIITWIRNPYSKYEVKINKIKKREYFFLLILSIAVSIIFYFILRALNTSNLIFSTISIFTSFTACYLSMRRCEFYAVAYATNDIVLIIL